MDGSNDLNTVNDKIQANLLTIQQKVATRIIKALYCKKVDADNASLASLKCRECEEYVFNCAGRKTK